MNSPLPMRPVCWIAQLVGFFGISLGVGHCASALYIDGLIQTSSGSIRFAPDSSMTTPFALSGAGAEGSITGGTYSYAQYTATAGYGQMGVSFNAQAACNGAGCGQQAVTGWLQIGSSDVLHVTNAPASGRIQFSYSLSGGGSVQSPANGSSFLIDDELWLALAIRDTCGPSSCQQSSYSQLLGTDMRATIPASGTVSMPYSNSTLSFFFAFEATFSCYGDASGPCQLGFNLAPATLSNARVVDSSGNPIAGAQLVADSGFNYAAVPEPASLGFVVLGIASIAAFRFRSNKPA